MISIVDENMIIGTTIQNLPTTTCKGRSISKDSSIKVLNCNIFSGIILAPSSTIMSKAKQQF